MGKKLKHVYCFPKLFSENFAFNDIMWKIIVQPDRSQIKIWQRMRIACWIHKATNTHSECVILLFARQKWSHEIASMLLLQGIARLVYNYNRFNLQTLLTEFLFKNSSFCTAH